MPQLLYQSNLDNSEAHFPALMSGVFRSDDGALGAFLANASGEDQRYRADLDLRAYGWPEGATVGVKQIESSGNVHEVLKAATGVVALQGSLPGHGLTMFRIE